MLVAVAAKAANENVRRVIIRVSSVIKLTLKARLRIGKVKGQGEAGTKKGAAKWRAFLNQWLKAFVSSNALADLRWQRRSNQRS